MKRLLLSLLCACLLVGCETPSPAADQPSIDAKAVYGCNTINVYNAGEYISDETIPNFERRFQARVNYDVFDSNETLYTKLLGGSSYDVLIPSDYMIERLLCEFFLESFFV